jgi:hypothetical protein
VLGGMARSSLARLAVGHVGLAARLW